MAHSSPCEMIRDRPDSRRGSGAGAAGVFQDAGRRSHRLLARRRATQPRFRIPGAARAIGAQYGVAVAPRCARPALNGSCNRSPKMRFVPRFAILCKRPERACDVLAISKTRARRENWCSRCPVCPRPAIVDPATPVTWRGEVVYRRLAQVRDLGPSTSLRHHDARGGHANCCSRASR